MERSDFVLIYSAHDIGEYGFIRSLLEANQIHPYCPDQYAETYSMWTNPFFRQFSVYVSPAQADQAKELIEAHRCDEPPKTSRRMQWLARVLLTMVALALLGGFLTHIRR
jgi:hypothetical protein